jgi:hypothetical protein
MGHLASVANVPLIARAMNIGYLNCNAEFLPHKGFLECLAKNIQRHLGQLAFDLIASPVQNLKIECDEGSIRLTMANYEMVMLDNSAFNVFGHKLTGRN